MTLRRRLPVLACTVVAAALALAACGGSSRPESAPARSASGSGRATGGGAAGAAAAPNERKVLVLAEENHSYGQVLGSGKAPYLDFLAGTYGVATAMNAGYPVACPSLPAYLLMTSGDTHSLCDDKGPWAHPITGASIFSQVQASGRQWRGYAESMPSNCATHNSSDGRYLPRHAPATYYYRIRARCQSWQVPLGTLAKGAFRDDISSGRLPAFAFVTPDACHDMHGAPGCLGSLVHTGDVWLSSWLPVVLNGPDYRSGNLVVVITWDEGIGQDNHIPTVVVAPRTSHLKVTMPLTHCSLLRMEEDLLGLAPLGCAATAPSPTAAFQLA